MGHGFDVSKDQKYEGFSFTHAFAHHADVPDGAVNLSRGTFDSMKIMLDDKLGGKDRVTADGAPQVNVQRSDLAANYATSDAKAVLDKPPHALTDEEYFQIAGLMTPGAPWSAGGRGHEISLRTENINDRNVIVYDTWRSADPSQDSFGAKMGPNDIRCRIVFAPNESTGKLDVMWIEAKSSEFARAAQKFDQSLKSTLWK